MDFNHSSFCADWQRRFFEDTDAASEAAESPGVLIGVEGVTHLRFYEIVFQIDFVFNFYILQKKATNGSPMADFLARETFPLTPFGPFLRSDHPWLPQHGLRACSSCALVGQTKGSKKGWQFCLVVWWVYADPVYSTDKKLMSSNLIFSHFSNLCSSVLRRSNRKKNSPLEAQCFDVSGMFFRSGEKTAKPCGIFENDHFRCAFYCRLAFH